MGPKADVPDWRQKLRRTCLSRLWPQNGATKAKVSNPQMGRNELKFPRHSKGIFKTGMRKFDPSRPSQPVRPSARSLQSARYWPGKCRPFAQSILSPYSHFPDLGASLRKVSGQANRNSRFSETIGGDLVRTHCHLMNAVCFEALISVQMMRKNSAPSVPILFSAGSMPGISSAPPVRHSAPGCPGLNSQVTCPPSSRPASFASSRLMTLAIARQSKQVAV